MSNGFNPFDDDFITSDLQDHIILDEDDEKPKQAEGGRPRRRRYNVEDDDSDFKADDGGEDDAEEEEDNDSDWGSNGKKKKGGTPRRSGRPSRKRAASRPNLESSNGSSQKTSSGRVIRTPSFADDDEEEYDFGPKRKRGRPPKTPIPADSFKAVKDNPRLAGTRSYQRSSVPKDRCNLCNLVLKADTLIVEHIRDDHVLPSMNPEDLFVEKTGVKAFLCSLCNQTFDARIKFKFHKRSKHGINGGGEEEDAAIECDLCEIIVENKGELVIHKDSKHKNLRTYHCDHCNNKYFTADDLVDHRRVMHEDQVNKIVEPWVNVKRTDDAVLKEMFPAGQGYAKVTKRATPGPGKKSFPKRILDHEELPPSSPEKSPGNTSSSDFEPDGKDDDDDDDFDPSHENSTVKKRRSRRSRGRPRSSARRASSSGGGSKGLSLESLGIEGLSKEGLENFKSAPADIQKKVMKLLVDKKGREAVLKRLGANGGGNSSPGPSREDRLRKKNTSVSSLTAKLQFTLQKLLARKEAKPMFDCPECPHRFPSKELLDRHEKSAHRYKPPPKPVFTGTCQICLESIPNEKDYVQHLLSKHMTPDVDVLSVAAGILVKRVAKDNKKALKKKHLPPRPRTINSSTVTASQVSNDGSGIGTHDVDGGAGSQRSRTTIEPVIDDDEPVIDDGEPVIDEEGSTQ